jgi:GNAT superfamily N-acetyltransferase
MIIFSKRINADINQIIVSTEHGTAELSEFPLGVGTDNLEKPIYYFHRIKVRREFEGTGEGKELMIEVCRHADEIGATIFNPLNPYGKRGMKSLKSFFIASGFEDFGPKDVMIRKPKKWPV